MRQEQTGTQQLYNNSDSEGTSVSFAVAAAAAAAATSSSSSTTTTTTHATTSPVDHNNKNSSRNLSLCDGLAASTSAPTRTTTATPEGKDSSRADGDATTAHQHHVGEPEKVSLINEEKKGEREKKNEDAHVVLVLPGCSPSKDDEEGEKEENEWSGVQLAASPLGHSIDFNDDDVDEVNGSSTSPMASMPSDATTSTGTNRTFDGSSNDTSRIDEILLHVEYNTADEEGTRDATKTKKEEEERKKEEKNGWNNLKKNYIHLDAIRFATRISVVLTLSSLFILIPNPDDPYPSGTWVYVTALVVSWFPSLDAASVIEKTIQRILGTCLGAVLGLVCGFLSLLLPDASNDDVHDVGTRIQAVFLGCVVATTTFVYALVAVQNSFLKRYSYASIICILTFGITGLAFYTSEHPKWNVAVHRVTNVLIGCGIGGLGSILIWPRPTMSILRDKIHRQINLAGESSEAVLNAAADIFSGKLDPTPVADIITERRLFPSFGQGASADEQQQMMEDVAHQKYASALHDWKGTKAVFPLMKYDPFISRLPKSKAGEFKHEAAITLARALRIQTTIILMDGIVRNDRGQLFNENHLMLFRKIGKLIRTMLTVPIKEETNEAAADELLDRLEQIRESVVHATVVVENAGPSNLSLFGGSVRKEDFKLKLMRRSSGLPMCAHSEGSCSLLFLQLVEHLILRSLRLFYVWKQIEEI